MRRMAFWMAAPSIATAPKSWFSFFFIFPSRPHSAALKVLNCDLLGGCRFHSHGFRATCTPIRSVFDNPIEQSFLKSDIAPGLFTFNPFVTQNLVAFGEKLFVENRVLNQIKWFRLLRRVHKYSAIVQSTGDVNLYPLRDLLRWTVSGGEEKQSRRKDGACGGFHLDSFTTKLSMAPLKRSSILFPAALIRSRFSPEPSP